MYARFFAGSGDTRFLLQPPLAKLAMAMSRPCTALPRPIISPWFISKKGEKKEETARPHLDAATRQGKDRVVLIGVAQEKASIWKSWPRKGQEKARHPHMDWGREMAYVNHFYFYLWDSEWGAAFWKTNAYALSHLAMAEWPRLGQTAVGESRHRL
jgi:hypothetical protein